MFAELGGGAADWRPVTLPHDAMLTQERSPAHDSATAYYAPGVFEYRKRFAVPRSDSGKRIVVEFEGVYRSAMVYVNGAFAGQRPYGYSQFDVELGPFLRYGEDNEIRVEARTGQDSRWYSGAGIYRDTWLIVGEPVRIALDGVRVTTPDVDADRAVVEVAVTVENDTPLLQTVNLSIEVPGSATGTTPVTVGPRGSVVSRRHPHPAARPRVRPADQRRDGEAPRRVRPPRQRPPRRRDDRPRRGTAGRNPQERRFQRDPQLAVRRRRRGPGHQHDDGVDGRRDEPGRHVGPGHGRSRTGSSSAPRRSRPGSTATGSWSGVTVEVYSDADEVELLVDGRSLGRRKAGFRAEFEAVYEPSELVAVAYADGVETGR